jgi:type III restriction enzyme
MARPNAKLTGVTSCSRLASGASTGKESNFPAWNLLREHVGSTRLAREFHTQKIIFETARDVYDQIRKDWKGGKDALLAQLVRLVEQFIRSDKIAIIPALFSQDDLKRRLIITLNMTKVVQHIGEGIRFENAEKLEPVFDRDRPIRSTGDMGT